MEISNYTTRIISEIYNLYFVKKEMSTKTFIAADKIKKDLTGKEIPEIDMDRVFYYDTSFKGDVFYADEVQNIDIKCAYCSLMKNKGLISEDTFNYVISLNKPERLAALGMIASRKKIYIHEASGKVIQAEPKISPLAPFFFWCVQETEKIIQSCKNQILMDSFLFSWVDGIYYLNANDNYRKITQMHLKRDFNLGSSFQRLTNFEVIKEDEYYDVSFLNEKQTPKTFSIPLPESFLLRQIVAHLLTSPQ